MIKGQREYDKWQRGEKITRTQAVLANCYSCNGLEQSREDCCGDQSCPLYQFSPYRSTLKQKVAVLREIK